MRNNGAQSANETHKVIAATIIECNRGAPVRYKSYKPAKIMASIKERLGMAAPVIDKIVQSYKQDECAQLIDLMLQGWGMLEKQGLGAWSMVHASKALILPRNRGNGMLEISHVSEQVEEISRALFSLHEVLQACGVRMPPKGSDERKETERMNEELVAAAHGHLAPVVRDDAEIMVAGCSHNSAGLTAIHAGGKVQR